MNTLQIIKNATNLDLVIELKAVFQQMWFELGRLFAIIYGWLMFKKDIYYRSPIPSGAKILAANHPCTIDPVMMTTLVPEPVSIFILDTLFKIPLFGASLKFSGHIPVVEGNGKASLDEGLRGLESGRTLGIFPEGVITPSGANPVPSHTGAARLAIFSGVPVIPVGIYLDPRYIYRIKSKVKGETEIGTWYFHGPYAMTVGDPMTFKGNVEDRAYVREVTDQIMTRVAALSRESAYRIVAARRMPVSSWVYEAALFLWAHTMGYLRTV